MIKGKERGGETTVYKNIPKMRRLKVVCAKKKSVYRKEELENNKEDLSGVYYIDSKDACLNSK